MIEAHDTIAVMVSIGNREHLSSYTFPRLSAWAAKHGYSSILLKKPYNPLDRPPHFNKLQVHQILPQFKRYIIVDDDLLFSERAPAMEEVPSGFVGACMDAEQRHTNAAHVKWTANTGFLVFDKQAQPLLDLAYEKGIYPYGAEDDSDRKIWGPFDQGILNDVLFTKNKIYKLDSRWNYQPILEYFINGKGWDKWKSNRLFRLKYYVSLLLPFANQNKKNIRNAYGLHLIRGPYPSFFSKIFK